MYLKKIFEFYCGWRWVNYFILSKLPCHLELTFQRQSPVVVVVWTEARQTEILVCIIVNAGRDQSCGPGKGEYNRSYNVLSARLLGNEWDSIMPSCLHCYVCVRYPTVADTKRQRQTDQQLTDWQREKGNGLNYIPYVLLISFVRFPFSYISLTPTAPLLSLCVF